MVSNVYPIIAREGWPVLLPVAGLALLTHLAAGMAAAVPLWLALVLAAFLFRDPPRQIPASPLAVVCPIHGRVTGVDEEAVDEWRGQQSVRITLRMGPLDVYSLRSPTEGKIMEQWLGGAQGLGRRSAYWIRTDEDDDVVLALTPGHFLARVVCGVHTGERVGHGQRIGLCYFSAQADLYLPPNCQVEVRAGDHVAGGARVAARLVHEGGRYVGAPPEGAA